jgi:hypothetical protein
METAPQAIVPDAASRLGTMPLSFALNVKDLAPGKYDCQVTVLDPATQKATFWQSPIMLAQ